MDEDIKLPEPVAWIAEYGGDVYTADQLRAAVEADRAKRALGGYSEDQIAQAAMEAEIPDAKLESLLIALTSTPAPEQPARKPLTGAEIKRIATYAPEGISDDDVADIVRRVERMHGIGGKP